MRQESNINGHAYGYAQSINDNNGCSICAAGRETYTTYTYHRTPRQSIEMYQYDYRTPEGDLFSCCAPSLEDCRARRDNWLNNR